MESIGELRRRPTAVDVGNVAGVSRATVGFVFNNTPGQTITDATRERVLNAAAQLGYRPHAGAQALARGSSRTVLLVLPDWPVGYSMQALLDTANAILDDAGYTLVTYTPRPAGSGRPLWEILEPAVVMGMAPFTREQLASMRAQGITHIVPDSADAVAATEPGPVVQVDHLFALGHRRIAYASSRDPRLADLSRRRFEAAAGRASELGLPEISLNPIRSQQDVEAAVRQWKKDGTTAVAAYNDDIAAMIVGAAIREGTAVPGELSVIGHDDSPIAELFVPSLSSVRRDSGADGRMLADLAIARAEGREIAVDAVETAESLVPRQSTAPAR